VRFEVAREVRPAELAARERQMTIGPPAISGQIALVSPSRLLAWSSWRSVATCR
jgi:hypothetical protein